MMELYFHPLICLRGTVLNQLGDGSFLFRLRNITIVGYFYYLLLVKLLHVLVIRPSSRKNILLARSTRLTTGPLFLKYS
jgi:hypothetical protein